MKVRNGFISNSSSSSFIVIGKRKAIDDAKEKMSDFGKAVVESVLNEKYTPMKTITLDGNEYVTTYGEISSEDFAWSAQEEFEKEYDDAYEEWNKFQKLVKQNGGFVDEN